jgi:hydrogenase maturation factor
MCFAIAGGVKSIEKSYLALMKKHGIKGKVFNQEVPDFGKRIENVDAVILFTGTVSHRMACTCRKVCKKKGICIKQLHCSSLNQLEKALIELKE